MLARWIAGLVAGTTLIGITSPWFIRSYVPRVMEPSRKVSVLQPESNYRWRSEGYATTRIGRWGMPGQTANPSANATAIKLALWGDSQAEGVCVADDEKIAACVSRQSSGKQFLMPFARSGDDCNDWIEQINSLASNANPSIRIDAHVFLVVEWSDWCIDIAQPIERESGVVNRASRTLPAFVIQAIRNAVTVGDGNQTRSLRFRPGPVETEPKVQTPDSDHDAQTATQLAKLAGQLDRLHELTPVPCVFVYAPLIPAIVAGENQTQDPHAKLFAEFQRLCLGYGFAVIDLRQQLADSADRGDWPRGFHNGQFGVGHYNAIGNQIIATAIADNQLIQALDRDTAKD